MTKILLVLLAVNLSISDLIFAQNHGDLFTPTPSLRADDSGLGKWMPPAPFSVSSLGAAQLSKNDIRKFCDWQNYLMTQSGWMLGVVSPPKRTVWSAGDTTLFRKNVLGNEEGDQAYEAIRMPNSKLRKLIYEKYRNARSDAIGTEPSSDMGQTNFRRWMSASDVRTGDVFVKNLADDEFKRGEKVKLPPPIVYYGLCTFYGCPEGGKTTSNVAQDLVPEDNIVDMQNIRRLLSNPIYIRVMVNVALKIDDRISKASRGEEIGGTLFDDILAASRKFVPNDAEARNLTWSLLGAYGTRGANMNVLREKLKNGKIFSKQRLGISALQNIALGLSVLDQVAEERGENPYSLPSNVVFGCAYGKPYHFWMAAYIARKYSQKEGPATASSRRNAALAAHLALIGYNFGAEGMGGRDPSLPFTAPQFGDYSNSVRMTIAYGDAGAIYGAYMADNHSALSLDISEGFRKILVNSQPRSQKMTMKEFNEAFNDPVKKIFLFDAWKKFMGADAAFRTFQPRRDSIN